MRRATILLTSFIAYALGNSVGLGVLTGGAVRMRLYTAAGIEAGKVAQVVAFNASAFGFGMATFGALGLAWGARDVGDLLHVPAAILQVVAVIILLLVAALIVLAAKRREIHIAGRWFLRLPQPGLALRQLLISAADLTASAAALWFLLPHDVIGLPGFLAWYAVGVSLGIASHVPGGVGVFEAVILLGCGGRAPPEQIVGALVLYRLIYYLVPLVLAAMLLALYELRSGIATPVGRAAVGLSPLLLATLTFIAGAWLLVSGVTPVSSEASDLLALHVPLTLVEASHFIGSVSGLALLVISRGLLHRLDAAWWAAFALSIVAAILAMPKGIALSEAGYLSLLAVLLLLSRNRFDRRSTLFEQALEGGWLLSIGAVVAATGGVLFFAYKEVAYKHELWWQFELNGDAPRSLRAMMGVTVAAFGVGLWQLMRASSGAPSTPTKAEIERAAGILRGQPAADSALVLMGDKRLLFSQSGNAFVMYGRQGRSWISLFDPVGDRSEWPELIWRFIELADEYRGRPAFYQVRPEGLPLYLDAGLRALKLGEYAYVPLADFNLKGSRRANLRQSVNRAERERLEFTVIPPAEVRAVMPELEAVSTAWLTEHRTREKSFSLGTFDTMYVERQPVALVRRDGQIVAFANVLCTEAKVEASVDMMRQLAEAPGCTMEFLFTKLLLQLREEGYQRFGLGMAPMSGMATHELAPRWHRIGRWVFDHGEAFYNFRGLRSFKEKFDPLWEPRYLAASGTLAPLFVLADTAALIGGGLRGVVAR
jgi:phosphatidylglycerol lysyltransferase